MPTLSDRQQNLFEWLKNRGSATIEEIGAYLEISPATAYRDVRALLQAGLALKTSNGIKPGPAEPPCPPPGENCAFCGGNINTRSAFVFQLRDGSQRKACCPHCGLLALEQLEVASALSSDFLSGRMVNARQAVFLISSSVSLCCEPSALCFANQEQAQRFQLGFGGVICSLEQAAARIKEIMSIPK